MKLLGGAVVLAMASMVLVGCGSSSGDNAGAGSAASAPTSDTPTSDYYSATPTEDPNDSACSDVSDYVINTIKPTFDGWDIDANEFNKRVGSKLRDQGTHLYGLAKPATGSVSEAITDEAKALINISIAIEAEDDDALGTAATAGNSALATLRGACDF